MVNLVRRVFSHATIASSTDYVAAFYGGNEWITQEFELSDFLRLLSASSGLSLVATQGRTGIKFFLRETDTQNFAGISPSLSQPRRLAITTTHNNEGTPTEHSKPLSKEDYDAVLNMFFPNKEIVGIATIAKFKKLKEIITRMQALGFYVEYDTFVPNEMISDGGVALYVDSKTSRFPKVIRGELLSLFTQIFEVSDCVWIETKPDSGYLTIHCVVE